MVDSERRPRRTRLPHLDALRAVLVAWVIGGHALVGYSAVGGWAYDEVNEVTFAPTTELVLVAVLGPSGLFIIGVLFFIAGLLVEEAVQRHGWSRYTRDRFVRLGLPWLVSAVLVWPASVWLAYTAAGQRVSFWWVFSHRDPLLDSGALWFALVLLAFSVAFALTRPWTTGRRRRSARALTGTQLAATVVVIGLSSFLVRLWFPARSGQVGDLHLWQWPQCLGLFVLGIAAARSGWHRHVPERLRHTCGVVALLTLVLLPVLALASGVRDLSRDVTSYLGGWRWEALATAGVEGILVVTGSVWLVGMAARRRLDEAPATDGWAKGAFAAFVIQGPVLMALASAARPLDVPAELKAPLVATLGIVACFWLGGRLPFPWSRPRDPRPADQGPVPPGSAGPHASSGPRGSIEVGARLLAGRTIGREAGMTAAEGRVTSRGLLPPGDAWLAVARCVAVSLRLLVCGRLRHPRTRVGARVRFADGSTATIYRETVSAGAVAARPCALVVCFRLRWVRGRAHALFRAESLLNTPLFVGFPGFVAKWWLAADENGLYRGLYEWDGAERAEAYARALWRVLALVSVRGSIAYTVLPGRHRDDLLDPSASIDADAAPGAWWRPVAG